MSRASEQSVWAVAVRLLVAALPMLAAGCILIDPPSPLPEVVVTPPVILTGSVVPPTTQVLLEWPLGGFVVPVLDENPPAGGIFGQVLIDFVAQESANEVNVTPTSLDGGVFEFDFGPSIPLPSRGCHTLEFMVSAAAIAVPHEPSTPTLISSVTWFYSPTGDLTTCTTADAAVLDPDAGAVDASAH